MNSTKLFPGDVVRLTGNVAWPSSTRIVRAWDLSKRPIKIADRMIAMVVGKRYQPIVMNWIFEILTFEEFAKRAIIVGTSIGEKII